MTKINQALSLAAIFSACGLFAPPARAQDLGRKSPPQQAPIAIVNAAIHPVSGPDIPSGHIVFDKGLITEVAAGPYSGPAPAIDAAGKHVYPGLISAETSIGISEIGLLRASRDFAETARLAPEVYAAVAFNPDSTVIPVTRTTGVLTVGAFPSGGLVPGRASVMRLEGWTWEEMAVRKDAGLILNWPAMRTTDAWWMDRSVEDQQRGLDETLRALDDLFDNAASYAARRAAGQQQTPDIQLDAVTGSLPGAAPQTPVFIWAQEVDQITAAVSWSVARGLRPVIIGGRAAPLCADLLKKHEVPVIVLGTHGFPARADAPYDEAFTLPARLNEAGLKWCLASGEEGPHERSLPHHAGLAAGYGLPRDVALRSITLSAAEVLGVADRLGSLEPGKAATLFIADGDPLEVTCRVDRAFIDGRAIDLASKQSVLAEKYREKYRQKGLLPPAPPAR